MKNAIDKARAFCDRASEIWADRDLIIPAIKQGIRDLPSKYREAEPEQRRNLTVAIIVIVGLQALLLTTAI